MDFKNQWDQDEEKDAAKSEQPEQQAVDLEKETVATDNTPIVSAEKIETVESEPKTDVVPADEAVESSNRLADIYPSSSKLQSLTAATQDTAHKARRFLIAYMTTVFSAIVILYGTAWLGYVLIDHFLGAKKDDSSWFYLDLAPLYISLMATLGVFGLIYIVASRYVAKSASDDTIGLKDWRAYKVVYAIFTALLIATGASVVAGLLYIPIAQLLIADDLESKRILVTTLASLHVLVWIAILVWQERLVKKAKQSWLQGFVVVAGVAIVVVATGIFPVGSKTNDRYDHRVESDLSSLETKIMSYQSDNKGALPANLAALKFDEDEPLKGRINNYKYTVKETKQDSQKESASSQTTKVNATVLKDLSLKDGAQSTQGSDSENSDSDSTSSDEAYYNALYEAMYSQKSDQTSKSYELCATFRTDTTNRSKTSGGVLDYALSGASALGGSGNSAEFTKHKTGEVCFTRS